jgi:two-component system sensor histidine kinase YesM
MNIEKSYDGLSLRNKFFFIFLFISIIPFSFLIYYSYTSTRDQITEQSYASLSGTMNQINLNVENRLDYYHQLSNTLYMDAQLRNYLSNNYKQAFYYLDAFDYINRTLTDILTINANIEEITIYTNNKTLYSDGVFIKYMEELPENIKKDAFQAAGNTIYTHTSDKVAPKHYISLVSSLSYFSLTHPYGILKIDITDNELYSLIEQENMNKSIYIIDQRGDIITSTDKNLVSTKLYDTTPIEDQLISQSGRFDKVIGGQKQFVMYKRLSNGWTTVITEPYSVLLFNTNKATQRIIWISIISIIASILFIYITTKLITKRIGLLLSQIRKFESGNFKVTGKPMGRDEIGQLSFAFNKMAFKIRDLIEVVYIKEIAKKEAELTMLQAQINPHFLYNILSSISSIAVKQGDMQVYQMVNHLAKYYRISLNKGKPIIWLEQEINLVKDYISIQKIRFKDMLHMHYELDETLFRLSTIKLIIQPFVENAINHAVWNTSGINIIIKMQSDGNDILLKIIDDGMGMTRANLERAFNKTNNLSGYGIKNVDDRIKLTFGESYGVEIFSKLGIGTSVTIRIPKRNTYEF